MYKYNDLNREIERAVDVAEGSGGMIARLRDTEKSMNNYGICKRNSPKRAIKRGCN